MDSHLVTVEVGVERSTDKRVQLDCLTVDEAWMERLDRELVECRCTVEHNRIAVNYFT